MPIHSAIPASLPLKALILWARRVCRLFRFTRDPGKNSAANPLTGGGETVVTTGVPPRGQARRRRAVGVGAWAYLAAVLGCWVLLATALLLGPVMGLCVPWRPAGDGQAGLSLRVLTCNMHYGRPDPRPLDRLLAEVSPDVVALQEWGGRPEVHAALRGSGWHFV